MNTTFAAMCTRLRAVEEDFFRNVTSVAENVFADLTEDQAEAQTAAQAASLGRDASRDQAVSQPFAYCQAIGYAFDSANWRQTRFSDGRSYGAWYGSRELATTIYETAFHWRRFVLDSFAAEDRIIRGERQVFLVACQALLIDLEGLASQYPQLVHRASYGFCQALGAYLVERGQSGLLTDSARYPGVNAVIFQPGRLSDVRLYCRLGYETNPRQDMIVARRPEPNAQVWAIPAQDLSNSTGTRET